MLNLHDIKTSDTLPVARRRISAYAPRHSELNYAGLFDICRMRALMLWNTRIAPELNIQEQRAFERALASVGMRAGISIPWTFASGYAFGLACHAAAGNNPAHREEAAAACGLLMFFMGTYDHLLDEYPDEFQGIEKIINADSLENWANGNDLETLKVDPNKVLANGLLRLYQTYFKLCSRMFKRHPDTQLFQTWLQALKDIHRVEAESTDRRISKVTPHMTLIKHTEEPSVVAFWALAVTACMGESETHTRLIEKFAKSYGSLTWYADDFSDIEKDIHDDRWSGLAIRLALDAKKNGDIEKIVCELADKAGARVTTLYEVAGDQYWEERDTFSVADILWAYIWAWLGGETKVAEPQKSTTPAIA